MAELVLPPAKRVPLRVGSGAEPLVKRQIHSSGETPLGGSGFFTEDEPMTASKPSSGGLPASSGSQPASQQTQEQVIVGLKAELLKLQTIQEEAKNKAKGGKSKEGKGSKPKAHASKAAAGAGAVDVQALQALAVSTARLSLAEAHQGRHHRAIVADGVLIPRETPLVQAIKDRTKELADVKAGLATQKEKDALGEPHCYAWNALVGAMIQLAKDKKETAAEALLSSYVSVHLAHLTSLEEKIKVIGQQISHCWVARAHKQGEQFLAKLHVGAIMSKEAMDCWQCIKEMLVKHCGARVLAGTAPRGHQERQVQLQLNSMGQSSPWTDW
jgi:hypothetical protein